MDINFPDLPKLAQEFRIWWINAGIGGVIVAGVIAIMLVLAYRSHHLLQVWLDYRKTLLEHSRRDKLLQSRIERELERREKDTKE